MTIRWITNLTLAAVMFAGAALASAADVEVSLSPFLQGHAAKINSMEQKREALFRNFNDDQRGSVKSARRLARVLYKNARWAGAELIADVDDYTLKNLVAAMVEANLQAAGINNPGETIRVELDRMRLANYSIAILNGPSSYVRGKMSRVDSAGRVIEEVAFTANLVIRFSSDRSYDGPDMAFADTDPDRRIGPVLSYFVKRGLEKLFPGKEFRSPIVLTFS